MGALLDSLPEITGDPKRDAAILERRDDLIVQYVSEGRASWQWSTFTHSDKGRTVTLQALTDCVQLEGCRVDLSATGLQRAADWIGGLLLTPQIADLVYAAAPLKVRPYTRTITASTAAMRAHSAQIDAALGSTLGTALTADCGKDWVLVNALVNRPAGAELPAGVVAANYGWHCPPDQIEMVNGRAVWRGVKLDPTASPFASTRWLIQSVGTRHARSHVDYSQTARIVSIDSAIDDASRDLRSVLQDSALAYLVSHEGPLATLRQPGVPPTPGAVVSEPLARGDGVAQTIAALAGLHPAVDQLARRFLADAANQGLGLLITEGYRSPERQDILYSQGRTRPGAIVTWVRGGASLHNFGLAFDVARKGLNDRPTWPSDEAWWQRIGAMGEALGLTWGGRWPAPKTDRPHFQWSGGLTLEQLRAGQRPAMPAPASGSGMGGKLALGAFVAAVLAAAAANAGGRRRRMVHA